MKPFVTIVAMLVTFSSVAQAQAEARRFACEGARTENGYPYGRREIGRTKFRFLDDGERSAVVELGPTDANFCVTGAECAVSIAADIVQLDVGRAPGWDPGYSSRFRFDRRRLKFEASGGGLDGEWSVSGKCKAEPVTGQ